MPTKKKIATIIPCRQGEEKVKLFLEQNHGLDNKVLEECIFYCNKMEKTELFCVNKEEASLIELLLKKNLNPYNGGLYLGKISNERFEPSLQLGKEIIEHVRRTGIEAKRLLVLSDHQGIRFTYGKSVSLTASREPVTRDDSIYLVVNSRHEFLGWGVIRNGKLYSLLDIGWYLRKGG